MKFGFDGFMNKPYDQLLIPTWEQAPSVVKSPLFVRVVFLLPCVLAWYITNGTNFIALQSFSIVVSSYIGLDFRINVSLMATITSAQLGIGALLGCAWLRCSGVEAPLHSIVHPLIPSAAGVLHGICSFSMNLACMYGTATLVQALKMLEPFDTLMLGLLYTRILYPGTEERGIITGKPGATVGVISSVAVIIAAAISLIGSNGEAPHFLAVTFAVISSLALCSRNVLQKHVHEEEEEDGLTTLQCSVRNFTKFSFQGFLLNITGLFLLLVSTAFTIPLDAAQLTQSISWKLFLCHPLYNLFSIITLGFVSALTHSLLNVGKRLFGIILAIAIFHEPVTSGVIKGLLLTAVGGIWYTFENRTEYSNATQRFDVAKPLVTLFILTLLPKEGSLYALRTVMGFHKPLVANTVTNQTSRSMSLVSTLPYEPAVSSDCQVKFKDANMTLCHFIPYDGNFGDELGPVAARRLLEYNFGCSADDVPVINLAEEERKDRQLCLFDLGSIFHMVTEGDHVWGTGINPYWQKRYSNNVTFYSVRGPKTAELIRKRYRDANGEQLTLGYGDPGFLIPYLYQEYNRTANSTVSTGSSSDKRICFVPHFHDLDNEAVQEAFEPENILSVQQHWEPMVESLAQCDYVASSSLHGLIISDALGIPNRWFQFEGGKTKTTEGHFKYLDYYLSMNRTVLDPLNNLEDVMLHENYPSPMSEEFRDSFAETVVDSFPFHLFQTQSSNYSW